MENNKKRNRVVEKSVNHNSLINAFNNAELSWKIWCEANAEAGENCDNNKKTGNKRKKVQSIISIELSPTFNFPTCEKSENMHFNAFYWG